MTRRRKTRAGRKNLRRQNEERLQHVLHVDQGDEDKSSTITENETFAEAISNRSPTRIGKKGCVPVGPTSLVP
jgi:hypothetical protein